MPLDHLQTFAKDLKSKFELPGSASPEDQLKGPVSELIKHAGKEFGIEVNTKTEAHLAEESVRPDMAVYTFGLICGYVELKQPGLGANAPKLKGKHNKEQWERLKSIPNLIYTDGQEWALYRNGQIVGSLVKFRADPTEDGASAIATEDAKAFEALLRDFLSWKPIVPHRPTELAAYLAPLTRFLRSEIEQALAEAGSDVALLAAEWRQYFFPDADDTRFADAYAQTVTYALLLARLSGATSLSPTDAAKTLDKGNRLLARALELLGQPGARKELRVGFELLQRSLEALDPAEFLKTKPDLWLYFYELFLAAYDPKLRNDYGVYYTPREVVELQIRLASELLDSRFKKKLGFADDGVVFIDPGVGTGTYLVAAISHALEKVRTRSGKGAIPGRASQIAENMYAFEILVGPYAVAHLRVTQAIEGIGGSLPADGRLKIYLADTLESPNASPPGGLTLTYKALTQEHEAARKIKQGGDILVCIGNPPYDRQQIDEGDELTQRKGGWVRFGDEVRGGAKQEKQGERPILEDFLEPARRAGAGIHLKNLYNDYVYFWRWALWRLFEQQKGGGIVTFITASSYIAGPGFVGMREVMRRSFDELWIIDLGGDNLGTRKTPNVFNIQTPVAIAIGFRRPDASPETPAVVRYAKIEGNTRNAKLAQLTAVEHFDSVKWQLCPNDWDKPFLPAGKGSFFEWPQLTDLFPWAHSGVQFKRSWPIGETTSVLDNRWFALRASGASQRAELFRETRDRKITSRFAGLKAVAELTTSDVPPETSPYLYRTFDRRQVFLDIRLGDYLRPALLRTLSDKQIFLSSLLHIPLGKGQGALASSLLPDMDHFRGSFGG
jgi:hypothetical protein